MIFLKKNLDFTICLFYLIGILKKNCPPHVFIYLFIIAVVQCYCGNTIRPDAKKAPPSECGMRCQGYGNETCGGDWRISVFPVQCSGPPVPPPPERPYLVNPCRNASSPFAAMPFCNATLPIDQRIADAVKRMTLEQKINALGSYTSAIDSLVCI